MAADKGRVTKSAWSEWSECLNVGDGRATSQEVVDCNVSSDRVSRMVSPCSVYGHFIYLFIIMEDRRVYYTERLRESIQSLHSTMVCWHDVIIQSKQHFCKFQHGVSMSVMIFVPIVISVVLCIALCVHLHWSVRTDDVRLSILKMLKRQSFRFDADPLTHR